MKIVPLGCAAFMLLGCDDPIVGDWEAEDNDSTFEDTIYLNDSNEGGRHVQIEDGALSANYDQFIEWTASGDGEYEAEIRCSNAGGKVGSDYFSGCADTVAIIGPLGYLPLNEDLDFDAHCTLFDDIDKLTCNGGGSLVSYLRAD